MYDYVVVLLFDDKTNIKLLSLKNMLEVESTLKLPYHITIDLYENITSNKLTTIIDQFISEINLFPFRFIKVDNFDNNVLFLQPDNEEKFLKIKNLFDLHLSEFKIKDNTNNGIYKPHTTLIKGEDIVNSQLYLETQFTQFDGNVTGLGVFSKDKTLIKGYKLNGK